MLNQITIGTLTNNCRFYGMQTDASLVSSELKRTSQTVLPQIIGAEIDRQLSSLTHGNGIYRIKKIRLKFTVLRSDLSLGRLADVLAARLVTALAQQLAESSGNVVYFKNEADFVAALMSDLLMGRAWDSWVYEEFAALRHLDAMEAVVQLLLSRNSMLADVVPGLQHRQQLSNMLEMLNVEQATRLFQQWTGHSLADQFKESSLPDLAELQSQLARLQSVRSKSDHASEPLVLLSLRVYLTGLAQGLIVGSAASLWVAAHYSFLRRYGSIMLSLLKQNPPERADLQSLLEDDVITRQIAADLLQWSDANPDRYVYLEKICSVTQNSKAAEPNGKHQPAEHIEIPLAIQSNISQVINSESAGLILLLPVIVSLDLHKHYRSGTLRTALTLALHDDESLAQPDWLNTLIPDVDDELSTDGPMPATWHLGLTADLQKKIAMLTGAKQLASLLLAHFAARLSGLQHSSAGYLRAQFLHHSGTIEINEVQVIVHLKPIALNIVLQMAGFAGWQEQLPWLKRKLIIEIDQ